MKLQRTFVLIYTTERRVQGNIAQKNMQDMLQLKILGHDESLLVNYGMYSLRTQFLSWEYDIFPFLRIVDTSLWYFTVVGAFIIFLVGTRDIIKAK